MACLPIYTNSIIASKHLLLQAYILMDALVPEHILKRKIMTMKDNPVLLEAKK